MVLSFLLVASFQTLFMKQLYFFLSFLFFATISLAQTSGTIKGKLVDSVGKQSLKDASITVLESKDSTLEVFGLAKADGTFELKNISFGKMLVQITFQGSKQQMCYFSRRC